MATWTAQDGTRIYFEKHGAHARERTLLLLPGLLGSVRSQWRSFVPMLSPHYTLLLVDLRGHGRSENVEQNLDVERMVQDVQGVLDHHELESVDVAGYSLGGYLGLMLALREPNRFSSLLMHATKFYWTDKAVAEMQHDLDPEVIVEKAPAYANQLAQDHGSRWRPLVRQAADLVAVLRKEGLTEGMARQAQMPVLVSVGDRDEMVSLPEAARLSRVFSDGMLLVFPGVRHPFSTLHPELMLSAMKAFLDRSHGARR